MIWFGLGILYLILFFTTGLITLRKGHMVLFVLGFFFPLLWIIGALLQPTEAAAEALREEERGGV